MRFSYVVFFQAKGDAHLGAAERAFVADIVGRTPGLTLAHLYTPAQATDFYIADGAGPQLGLQLYFAELTDLEAAIAGSGHLQELARPGALPSLADVEVTQQAMLTRRYPVPDERLDTAGGPPCSYVVHYPGPAADFNAWIGHYIAHHPPVMARFPGVRQIEILTRVDWHDAMPWRRADHMQRNRILFDSPAALTAALQSPARHELRADFRTFPPFEGGNFHFPMATQIVQPHRQAAAEVDAPQRREPQ